MEDSPIICPICQATLIIGSWPYCRGNQSDHGTVYATKSAVFPFESRHVTPDGKPLVIESMNHLRKVERDYGVVFSAFNNELNNSMDSIKDPPRYRGDEQNERTRKGTR